MPVAAAIAPIAGSVIGAVAGSANKRPPSLSPTQQTALNSTINAALPTANGAPTIDPTLQATALDANARSLTGANNQVDHALASRGLARSGVAAAALQNNAAQSSANQTNITNNLQNQAIGQKNFAQQLIAKLTQTPDIPGQSGLGAFTASLAGTLPGAIASAGNAYENYDSGGGTPNTSSVPASNQGLINSGVFGTVPFINPVTPPSNYGVSTN
jgi:hypothetical protein